MGQSVQKGESLNIFSKKHRGYPKPNFAKEGMSGNGKECVIVPISHTSAAEPEERSAWQTRMIAGILQACSGIA